ncbi:hypothetical protein [Anaerotruncus massiliensis (ex Togo et al. 2019)]|uniref:hypothetical protein n=1 Tax=Anaerotruncus massiliensis (ex Togo et al. 2019) TaxID=1673720 RepID=UPI0027B9C24B|nr:hypothetical protein [Anaerotruncus massiliensis (ex Togo et al. 2019)]
MIYTNTGATIPATLTDAPAAYKDGVTDTLWHPAITLVFDREAADAEITALLAGASAIYQDDGTYRTAYALDGRRIRHHPTSVTLPYAAKTTQDSPRWLRQQTTDADLARMEAEQRATDLDLQLLEVQHGQV